MPEKNHIYGIGLKTRSVLKKRKITLENPIIGEEDSIDDRTKYKLPH